MFSVSYIFVHICSFSVLGSVYFYSVVVLTVSQVADSTVRVFYFPARSGRRVDADPSSVPDSVSGWFFSALQ